MHLNDHNLPGQLMIADGNLERAISEAEAVTEMRHSRKPEESVRSLYRNPWGRLQGAGGGYLFFQPGHVAPTRGPVPDLVDPPSLPVALMFELAKVDPCQYLSLGAEDGYRRLSEPELVSRINKAAQSGFLLGKLNGEWGWWAPEDHNKDEV